MNNAQQVNPAPALYAAAIAMIALGFAGGGHLWIAGGFSRAAFLVALCMTVAPAAIAVASVHERFGPVALSTALFGTVICSNGAMASLFFVHYLTGSWVIAVPLCIIFILLGGLSSVGVVASCRLWFSHSNSAFIIAIVALSNALVVAVWAARSASKRDIGSATTVDFYGLFGEITYGLAVGSSTAFGIYFFTVIVLLVAIPTATLWRNTLINRKVFVVTTSVSVLGTFAVITYVAFDSVRLIIDRIEPVDVISAIVAAVISIFGCAMAAALMGVIVWWYRALRRHEF